MHKNIRAAIIRQDEAKSAIWIEEFDPPSWHGIKPDPTLPKSERAPRPAGRRAGARDNAPLVSWGYPTGVRCAPSETLLRNPAGTASFAPSIRGPPILPLPPAHG